MIDVYGIGVTLKLTDLVAPQLMKLSEQFVKLDALALQVNKRLQKMGAETAGVRNLAVASKSLGTGLKDVNTQALLAEKNIRAIKGGMPLRGLGIERELIGANAEALALERRLVGLRAAGRTPLLGGGRGNGGGGGAGGGGGGGAGGGRGHRGGLHGGNLHVGPGGVGIGSVGMGLAADAMVPLAVAGAAVYTGHQFYEAAKDYDMAFNRFKTLNLGSKIDEDANAFARGTHQFGVSMTDRMTILRDMHEVMGSYEEAKAVTPLFSRMLAANVGVFGEEGNKFDTKTFQALGKVIEMRGGTNSEAEMFKQADFAQKTLTGSAGLVTPEDLLAFSKTGGVAARLLSNKAFYQESAPLIQEMGGNKFGTALMSAHQNLAMGRGSLKSMKEAARLGIIDEKMIEYTKIGTIKQVLPGALKDDELYNTSKYQWLMKSLIPAIREKGVRGKDGLVKGNDITDDQIVNELNTIYSQRTAGNAFAQMYLQRHKIDKNVNVTEGAMGIDALEKTYKNSASGAEAEFSAAWKDFKAEFGKSMLPAISDMLKNGAVILRAIGDFVEKHGAELKMINSAMGAASNVANPVGRIWDSAKNVYNDFTQKKPDGIAPKTQNQGGNVHTTINVDGKKLATAVTPYLASKLGSGLYPSTIDNSLGLQMPGLK